MKEKPPFRAVLAWILLTILPTAAFSGTCILPRDLLNQPLPERPLIAGETEMPCYQLEAAYLLGLGVPVMGAQRLMAPISEEYRYYEYIRAFLAGELNPEITTQADQEALLLAALAVLQDDGGERYQAYRYFITRQYWRMNPQTTRLSAIALQHVLALSSAPGVLKTEQDVDCFIRADYPVFPLWRSLKPRFSSAVWNRRQNEPPRQPGIRNRVADGRGKQDGFFWGAGLVPRISAAGPLEHCSGIWGGYVSRKLAQYRD